MATKKRMASKRTYNKAQATAAYLPARFLRDGARRAKSVCRLESSGEFGTGFLIAPGVLITNNHVLGSPEDAAACKAEFDVEEGGNELVVSVDPGRGFFTDKIRDFTIVALSREAEEATAHLEPITLHRKPATVTLHERLNIIEHPRAGPKQLALRHNEVTEVKAYRLRYETETEPGSSGSPVFNDGWQLVALHHAGETGPQGKTIHEGIPIAAIVKRLLSLPRSHQSSFLTRLLKVQLDTSPDPTPAP